MENSKYYAPSVDMAARILDLLSRYKTKKCTLAEISRLLNINKSTCLRVLKTLESHNLVFYNPELKKYSLGIYTAVLGSRAQENLDYLSYIRPYLMEASEKTGLTATFLQRISKERMMFVSKHDPLTHAPLAVSIGNKFPITGVSYGRWLLAYMNEDERETFLAQGLPKVTEYTITEKEELLELLETIKKTGVHVSREEFMLGLTAISCPIFDRSKSVLGVIAVLGISSTISDYDSEIIANKLREISYRCSAEMANFVH